MCRVKHQWTREEVDALHHAVADVCEFAKSHDLAQCPTDYATWLRVACIVAERTGQQRMQPRACRLKWASSSTGGPRRYQQQLELSTVGTAAVVVSQPTEVSSSSVESNIVPINKTRSQDWHARFSPSLPLRGRRGQGGLVFSAEFKRQVWRIALNHRFQKKNGNGIIIRWKTMCEDVDRLLQARPDLNPRDSWQISHISLVSLISSIAMEQAAVST